MKIALLGATRSGKTAYFTGVYHRFRHVTGLPHLSRDERQNYKKNGIDNKVGLRIEIEDTELERLLAENEGFLMKRPIERWPNPTSRLDQSAIGIQFDFLPIDDDKEQFSYQRTIELYDPTGEAFTGQHHDSSGILTKLKACDIGVIFLSAEVIMTSIDPDTEDVDEDRLAEITGGAALGRIIQLLKKMDRTVLGDDVFPVCFVISQFDRVPKDKLELVNKIIFERIIHSFSKDNKRFLVCVCPVSLKHPTTGNFQSVNLEWPFLFATGGVIFRNSLELRKLGETYDSLGRDADHAADRYEDLYNRSKWDYFWGWLFSGGKESFVSERKNARSYYNDAGRKIEEADDDKFLARAVWSSIATEGPKRGVWVFMGGKKVNIMEIV
jgi:hypothetical protein